MIKRFAASQGLTASDSIGDLVRAAEDAGGFGAMGQVFAQDPNMEVAFDRSQAALEDIAYRLLLAVL